MATYPEAVEALRNAESDVIAAGRLAVEMQGRVDAERKTDTGNWMVDVVTEADRAVQRALMEALTARPALRACHLIAEEVDETGVAPLFTGARPLWLTVDPIDGTRRYVDGKPWYSTIIGLHDADRPLYSFIHYPALGWWIRLEDTATMSGPPPEVGPVADLSRTVVYTQGRPHRDAPEFAELMEADGWRFSYGEDEAACGSKLLVLSGRAGGYFAGLPNAYDGLFALHYGMATGWHVETRDLDLGQLLTRESGFYHPGWFLVHAPIAP